MNRPRPTAASALKGWRARAWAWVLFIALFKGLVPQAALASVLMQGDPALVWCAPGLPSVSGDGKAVGGMSAAGHACVCASAGDGALPLLPVEALPRSAAHDQPQASPRSTLLAQPPLPPPARGPPAL
ncbi:MAG: hypothetical protein V4709_01405 [Pseudomonadota bacterium]